jgi:predicted dehydrogenase
LCTPTPLHPEQAIAALKAGKNVLCEKPLARTSAAARDIQTVAAASPGFLMPAMCMRFWPGWSWLKKVVAENTYGRVLAARFRRMSEMPGWSKQGTYGSGGADLGGALFDLHIHDTDFIQFLFGRPQRVFSSGVMDAGGSINHVVTQYLYQNGPAIYAEGSWLLTKGFNMAYTLHCDRATLDFDLTRGAEAMLVTEAGQSTRVLENAGPDGYTEEIRYAVSCAVSRQKPSVVTAADGVSALEICEAEEKSVRTGQVVPV